LTLSTVLEVEETSGHNDFGSARLRNTGDSETSAFEMSLALVLDGLAHRVNRH
jgi:hypothetical protein